MKETSLIGLSGYSAAAPLAKVHASSNSVNRSARMWPPGAYRTAFAAWHIRQSSAVVRGYNAASVPIPKFASLYGALVCELRKSKDTSNLLT